MSADLVHPEDLAGLTDAGSGSSGKRLQDRSPSARRLSAIVFSIECVLIVLPGVAATLWVIAFFARAIYLMLSEPEGEFIFVAVFAALFLIVGVVALAVLLDSCRRFFACRKNHQHLRLSHGAKRWLISGMLLVAPLSLLYAGIFFMNVGDELPLLGALHLIFGGPALVLPAGHLLYENSLGERLV